MIRFSLRDKRLFEITEVEIMRVEYIFIDIHRYFEISVFEKLRADCTIIKYFIEPFPDSDTEDYEQVLVPVEPAPALPRKCVQRQQHGNKAILFVPRGGFVIPRYHETVSGNK